MEKPWKSKKIAEFSTLYLREWFVNLGRSWNRVAISTYPRAVFGYCKAAATGNMIVW